MMTPHEQRTQVLRALATCKPHEAAALTRQLAQIEVKINPPKFCPTCGNPQTSPGTRIF